MYPILVNAIAATAGNLIDRWSQSVAQRSPANAASFQQVFDAVSAARPASGGQPLIDKLKTDLLSSPELRTAVGSADPAHPVSVQISQDGSISVQAEGRAPQIIGVSPETAGIARNLAALMRSSDAGAAGVSIQLSPFTR